MTTLRPGQPGAMFFNLPWDNWEEYPLRVKQCPQIHAHERHAWTSDEKLQGKRNPEFHTFRRYNCHGLIDYDGIRLRRARQLAMEAEELRITRRMVGLVKSSRETVLYDSITTRMGQIEVELRDLAKHSGKVSPLVEEDDEEPMNDGDAWG